MVILLNHRVWLGQIPCVCMVNSLPVAPDYSVFIANDHYHQFGESDKINEQTSGKLHLTVVTIILINCCLWYYQEYNDVYSRYY